MFANPKCFIKWCESLLSMWRWVSYWEDGIHRYIILQSKLYFNSKHDNNAICHWQVALLSCLDKEIQAPNILHRKLSFNFNNVTSNEWKLIFYS